MSGHGSCILEMEVKEIKVWLSGNGDEVGCVSVMVKYRNNYYYIICIKSLRD